MATTASGYQRAFAAKRQTSRRTLAEPHDESAESLRLMHAAQRGDRASLVELIRLLQDVWFRFCRATLAEEHLARDATQETAVRFLQQLPSFRGDSSVRTWSLGIALNVTRELRRKHGRVSSAEPMEQASSTPSPTHRLASHEASDALRVAMRSLTERQREAIVLRYFEHRSIAETASLMGCAEGTVKATLAQSLRRLREHWSDDDER